MAKTKADLLAEAAELNLAVTEKNTVAEITEALSNANEVKPTDKKSASETKNGAETVPAESDEPKATAKAGKRSSKGIEEAEARAEKIEKQHNRAEDEAEEAAKPKQPVKPTRTRLERRGKNYRKAAENIEKGKLYSLAEALTLAQKTSSTKFDASVELHVRLGVDPRQADQNIRASLVLPAGTGKTVRIAVFADDKIDGVEVSGVDKITAELEKGVINFDVLISTPQNMAKLGKYARLLGPRGLMPNPKSGTVTADVTKAVTEAKAGRVEYRVDSTGIVHVAVGKVSFKPEQLQQNTMAIMNSIKAAKPNSVKGVYVKAVHITTSMGPSIAANPNE